MSPDETISSQADCGTLRDWSMAATRALGTGAFETRMTVPPPARNRASAAQASSNAVTPL